MEKKTILIVEDESIVALRIKSDLQKMGYVVAGIYASGEEALAGIKAAVPDLVLMDINLQGKMDGIETAWRINKNYDVPVIYLTAHSEENIIKRAKMTEPYGYILKPFNAKELRITVEVALYKHKIEQERAQLFKEISNANQVVAKSEKQLKDITSSLLEGIYVSDALGNILFMNPEAERLLGWTMMELMNRHVHEAFHFRKADSSPLPHEECNIDKVIRTGISFISRDEVFVRKDGTIFPISVVSSPITENGKVVAAVTAFRDMTERKQIERERDKLISELQEALANVKQLSGLLPICASCKKIRDDKGYWNQIETYISEHSEALFTHAICPECGKKLYPQYYDEIWGKEDKETGR